MKSLIVFSFLIGGCLTAGGMAELKSITGDAPYTGVGNAPAVLPQPMGFWGRPRYYGGFPGSGMGMMNSGWHPGMGWMNGDGGQFTSSSGGPYGRQLGHIPTSSIDYPSMDQSMEGMERENLMLGALTVLGDLINPSSSPQISSNPGFRSSMNPRIAPQFSSSSLDSFNPARSGTVSLSSATGGGFYKGKGNDFNG